MSRILVTGVSLFAAALLTGGCAKQGKVVSMGDLGAPDAVLSLGAGDALGQEIYVNDLILAAAAARPSTALSDATPGLSQ